MPPIRSAGPDFVSPPSTQEHCRPRQQRKYHPYTRPSVEDSDLSPEDPDLPLEVNAAALDDIAVLFETLSLGDDSVKDDDASSSDLMGDSLSSSNSFSTHDPGHENIDQLSASQGKTTEKEDTNEPAESSAVFARAHTGIESVAAETADPALQAPSSSRSAPIASMEDKDLRAIPPIDVTTHSVDDHPTQSNATFSKVLAARADINDELSGQQGLQQSGTLSTATTRTNLHPVIHPIHAEHPCATLLRNGTHFAVYYAREDRVHDEEEIPVHLRESL